MSSKSSFSHSLQRNQYRGRVQFPIYRDPPVIEESYRQYLIDKNYGDVTVVYTTYKTPEGKVIKKTIKITYETPHNRHLVPYAKTSIPNKNGGYTETMYTYTSDGKCTSKIVTIVY